MRRSASSEPPEYTCAHLRSHRRVASRQESVWPSWPPVSPPSQHPPTLQAPASSSARCTARAGTEPAATFRTTSSSSTTRLRAPSASRAGQCSIASTSGTSVRFEHHAPDRARAGERSLPDRRRLGDRHHDTGASDADVSGSIGMGGSAGQVLLVNSTTASTVGTGNLAGNAALVDMVGYGAAGSYEGRSYRRRADQCDCGDAHRHRRGHRPQRQRLRRADARPAELRTPSIPTALVGPPPRTTSPARSDEAITPFTVPRPAARRPTPGSATGLPGGGHRRRQRRRSPARRPLSAPPRHRRLSPTPRRDRCDRRRASSSRSRCGRAHPDRRHPGHRRDHPAPRSDGRPPRASSPQRSRPAASTASTSRPRATTLPTPLTRSSSTAARAASPPTRRSATPSR